MTVVDRPEELSRILETLRADGHSVGLVPTMGALHAGHRRLIQRAVQECDRVAVTIFVNPLQFGVPEDLAHYPRTLQDDLRTCQREGVAIVFVPPVEAMYPDGPSSVLTTVSVRSLTDRWEGAARPGHFDGVATVVAKLFAMSGRCRAYFGEKDYQQLAVVRRMAEDLSFPVEVVGCATVRERDGLALSSRNARLSRAERHAAAVLHRALVAGRERILAGETHPHSVRRTMLEAIEAEPLVRPDYAVVVDKVDLMEPDRLDPASSYRLLVAAGVGPVRLIDNLEAPAAAPSEREMPAGTPIATRIADPPGAGIADPPGAGIADPPGAGIADGREIRFSDPTPKGKVWSCSVA